MSEEVVVTKTSKSITDHVKAYVDDVKANKGYHLVTLLLGASTMRAVDTRVIRSQLGDGVANTVRAKLPLGNIPLING